MRSLRETEQRNRRDRTKDKDVGNTGIQREDDSKGSGEAAELRYA